MSVEIPTQRIPFLIPKGEIERVDRVTPDHILTKEEILREGKALIAEFIGIFSRDEVVQRTILEGFFDITHYPFERGKGIYTYSSERGELTGTKLFDLRRINTDSSSSNQPYHVEKLVIDVGESFVSKPTIIHRLHSIYGRNGVIDSTQKNNGLAVKAARDLLERTKIDFNLSKTS